MRKLSYLSKGLLMGAALLGMTSAPAMAEVTSQADIPTPFIYSPPPGTSVVYKFNVTWGWEQLDTENGRLNGTGKYSVTTPSGQVIENIGMQADIVDPADLGYLPKEDQPSAIVENGGVMFKLSLTNLVAFSEIGEYVLEIEEGAVTINNIPCPAATLTYVIEDESETGASLEEGTLSKVEDGVEITWPTDGRVLRGTNKNCSATVKTPNGSEVNVADDSFFLIDSKGDKVPVDGYNSDLQPNNGTALFIDLSEVVAEGGVGEYSLAIPRGIIYSGTYEAPLYNPAQTFTFTVTEDDLTGINGIDAANGVYNVYSISGVRVAKTDNVKDLNPGIYIINGKKTAIRK